MKPDALMMLCCEITSVELMVLRKFDIMIFFQVNTKEDRINGEPEV